MQHNCKRRPAFDLQCQHCARKPDTTAALHTQACPPKMIRCVSHCMLVSEQAAGAAAAALALNVAAQRKHTELERGQCGTRSPVQKHKRSAGESPACAVCCSHAVSKVVDMEALAAPAPWLQGLGVWTPSAAAVSMSLSLAFADKRIQAFADQHTSSLWRSSASVIDCARSMMELQAVRSCPIGTNCTLRLQPAVLMRLITYCCLQKHWKVHPEQALCHAPESQVQQAYSGSTILVQQVAVLEAPTDFLYPESKPLHLEVTLCTEYADRRLQPLTSYADLHLPHSGPAETPQTLQPWKR